MGRESKEWAISVVMGEASSCGSPVSVPESVLSWPRAGFSSFTRFLAKFPCSTTCSSEWKMYHHARAHSPLCCVHHPLHCFVRATRCSIVVCARLTRYTVSACHPPQFCFVCTTCCSFVMCASATPLSCAHPLHHPLHHFVGCATRYTVPCGPPATLFRGYHPLHHPLQLCHVRILRTSVVCVPRYTTR